jgi:hypothetical protein
MMTGRHDRELTATSTTTSLRRFNDSGTGGNAMAAARNAAAAKPVTCSYRTAGILETAMRT